MTTAVSLAQSVAPGVSLGFKNRIINGAMMIDQRNAGASVSSAGSGAVQYILDRWSMYENGSMAFSAQRSTTAPTGFINSMVVTTTTNASPSASTRSQLAQFIEGFNVADLGWGTASAKTITVSFWVRSSLTGQFGGGVQNSAQNRSYPFSFTISAANTFEYKTVTIPGDTSGTWLTDNGIGLSLVFDLGMGSDLLGTAGSWAAADYRGATGDVKLNETLNATFYITGVQLEVGTAATPFEFRDYGRELIMCQRYYEKSYDIGVAPGTASSFYGGVEWVANTSDVNWLGGARFCVTKRADPTITIYSCDSGATNTVNRYAGSAAVSVSSVDNIGMSGFMRLVLSSTPAAAPYRYQFTAISEL